MTATVRKPSYAVPTMSGLVVPARGPTVVSTFSGMGGSCLGFKMAGFRHLLACEFVKAARETYEANFPGVPVLGDDIRSLTVAEVLKRSGLRAGELDVFEGSPPCSSFSTAGLGEKGWGRSKKYSDERTQRTDDLFDEYLRLLGGLRPKTFVAENVTGMIKGIAKGVFFDVLARTKALGYRVKAQVLDAQWLGVPQARQRVIFLGVRDDLYNRQNEPLLPTFPTPLRYRYSIREALAGVVNDPAEVAALDFAHCSIGEEWRKLAHGTASKKYFQLVRPDPDLPSPTITQTSWKVSCASVAHPDEPRKFTIPELKRLSGVPDDFVLTGKHRQQVERLGRCVPPPLMYHVARAVRSTLAQIGR
jgi:DNA (cytosine-5)-methyltransferase 1